MHRHKKQSGGAGQFGEVHLRIEPKERGEGFEFVDAVKGGVIPGVFMAAVEKGVRQGLEGGVVAGYAVDDLKVTVFDGKTHAVDGKEVAFVTAGRKAVIEAIRAAKPIVLEPIVNIEIIVPEAAIGDLTGDLSSRRGHITGTDGRGHGMAAISGEVPLAETQRLPVAPEVADRRAGQLHHRVRALRGGAAERAAADGKQVPVARRRRISAVHGKRP
jgi:elongation factor G